MPAQSSSVIPSLPGALFVSMLSPGLSKFPACKTLTLKLTEAASQFTSHFCRLADIHGGPELLDHDELLRVGVEDDAGHAALAPHQVPGLVLAPLPVLQPHGGQESGLVQRNQASGRNVLHCVNYAFMENLD